MTVRILRDVEEAISREVRRITFHEDRTPSHTVLRDTFDPITGEVVQLPVEADFYDSSADASFIQYPHFFVKLLKMKEDRTTGRVIPQYGKTQLTPVATAPQAFETTLFASDGAITSSGNIITTSTYKIRKVQVGNLLRVRTGNNIGTYKVASVTVNSSSPHEIEVSQDLVSNTPAISFNTTSRTVTFLTALDLNTVKAGDQFVDSSSVSWTISSASVNTKSVVIGGVGSPSTAANGTITRVGNVFQTSDPSLVTFTTMDQTKPITGGVGLGADCEIYESMALTDPQVPIDVYYLVRIDSKERNTHVDVATRMWEEFNPPRTALPTVVRSRLSVDQKLTANVATGGSNILQITSNADININDKVFVFDDLVPTKARNGNGFMTIFESTVIDKIGTNQIVLADIVPDTFVTTNNTKIVTNAEYRTFMFHFVDHVTKDIEGAQYWSHEFTFWIQVWIDRQGEAVNYDGVVQNIKLIGVNIDDPEILD